MTTLRDQCDDPQARLTGRGSELLRRWLDLAQTQIPAAAAYDERVRLGNLPQLVALIQEAASRERSPIDPPELREAAQIHGGQRATLPGYPLSALLHEFSILSTVLVGALEGPQRRSARAREILRERVDVAMRWAAAAFADVRWEAPVSGRQSQPSQPVDTLQGLRALAPALEDALLLLNPDAKVQFVNPAAVALFGVKPDELLDVDLHDALHARGVPAHSREACPLVAAVRAGLSDEAIRLTVARPDGLSVPVMCALVQLDAGSGAALVCRLAVARRWEQDLLLGQHRILELIVRGEPLSVILGQIARLTERLASGVYCSILLVDEQHRLRIGAAPSLPQAYSQALEDQAAEVEHLEGRAADGLAGELAGDDAAVAPGLAACGSILAGRVPFSLGGRLEGRPWERLREVTEQLQLRTCWSMPIVASSGKALGAFVMYYQETGSPSDWEMHLVEAAAHLASIAIERVQAAEALRGSEDRYRTLLSNLLGAVYRCQAPDWRVSFVTGFIEELTAHSAREFMQNAGLSLRSVIHPEDRPRVIEAIDHAIAQQTPYVLEYRMMHAGAGIRWVCDKGRPVFDAAGQVVSLDGVLLDVTEKKHLEEELHRRAYELAEVDRRKNEFLAMLAHELRNPLAPITAAARLIRLHAGGNELLARAGGVIERQVQQLRRLVDDLLDVARITRGVIEIRREEVDLAGVIQNAVQTIQPLILARGHLLRLALPAGSLRVCADATRMEQVFTNLLSNAAKFTEPGGAVAIEGCREEGWAVVRVRDTGKGIPPDMLPCIFDLFTQVNPAIDRSQGGLGLGLTLVRSLVEMHGGSVSARSEGLGKGSELMVRLPLAGDEPRAPAAVTVADRSASVRCARVLVVDDNVDAAETLAELLHHWGYGARTAYDGKEALRVAIEYRPQVVLLDIGLPELDGYEVVRQVRMQEALKDAWIIALTGYGQVSDRHRALQSGFDEHLVKPVCPDHLRRLLQERLGCRPQNRSVIP